ncbi:hypothetical protein H6B13_03030 [Bacteroides gallinaceum]|nr:hypothetical protein [Bacteroides gallinaceum]MBM6718619.1 hypothetical protein [Bacteroides gallinaceum]
MYETKLCKEKIIRKIERNDKVKQNKNAIQRYFGLPGSSIKCKATIKYRTSTGKRIFQITEHGTGGSDASSSADVIKVFRLYRLNKLANVQKATNGNNPGQCAEPHAVADALRKINKKNRYVIDFIRVNDAIIANPTRSMINQGRNIGDIMPRCATCAQWINTNNYVSYLEE